MQWLVFWFTELRQCIQLFERETFERIDNGVGLSEHLRRIADPTFSWFCGWCTHFESEFGAGENNLFNLFPAPVSQIPRIRVDQSCFYARAFRKTACVFHEN